MLEQLHQPKDEKKARISLQELQNQLVVACEQGDYEAAKKLVAAGAQPHLPNDLGKIPVYCAFNMGDKEENRKNPVYPKLIDFLFAQIPTSEQKNFTSEQAEDHYECHYIIPLQERLVTACEQGNLGEVEKILKEGADPNLPDKRGKIPLFCAVWSMNTDLVNFLKRLQKNKEDLYARCWKHNLVHYKGMFVLNPDADNPLVLDRIKQNNKFVYNELLGELQPPPQTLSKVHQEKGSHPSAIPTEQKNTNIPNNTMTFFSKYPPEKFQELENFTQSYFSRILTGKSNSRRYGHIIASALGPNMLKAVKKVHEKLRKQITDELTGPVQQVKNDESIGRAFS